MKRTMSVLAATGLLGATLIGAGPASASTSAVDCSAGDYTRTHNSFVPTNVQRPGIDGFAYRIGTPGTYEVCLDVPDGSTFTIEIRIQSYGQQTTVVDDRPGDKIFSYQLEGDSLWQVYGTLTGPDSVFLHYTWNEKKIPA